MMTDSLDLKALREVQREYASRVVEVPLVAEPKIIAAVDMHLSDSTGVAGAVEMSFPDLEVTDISIATGGVELPYIPGFLSFREAPLCVESVRKLEQKPDLLLVDGHGKAHPVGCGLACHVGVELEMPTIGVAKSRLVGRYQEPRTQKGSITDLVRDADTIGKVVRTRDGVRPVFVSVGNLITLDEAVTWVIELARRYRLPEPSHLAHKHAQRHANILRV